MLVDGGGVAIIKLKTTKLRPTALASIRFSSFGRRVGWITYFYMDFANRNLHTSALAGDWLPGSGGLEKSAQWEEEDGWLEWWVNGTVYHAPLCMLCCIVWTDRLAGFYCTAAAVTDVEAAAAAVEQLQAAACTRNGVVGGMT